MEAAHRSPGGGDRGCDQEPSTPYWPEQNLMRPTQPPGRTSHACCGLLQAAHPVLTQGQFGPTSECSKGGRRAGWGCHLRAGGGGWGRLRAGGQGDLWNKFSLALTRVKGIFMALLTHWAFLPLLPPGAQPTH